MSDSLFSSDVEPADARYVWRLVLADLLDLATSLLLGWGLLRAVDVDRTVGSLALATLGTWVVMCAVGGLSGWTFWRGVVGLRLEKDGGPPGIARGVARALPALLELVIAPILQRRPSGALLRVHPEAVRHLSRPWRRGLPWQGLWVALALGAVWFMVMPTRREALAFLRKLDGWHCCHAKSPPTAFECTSALERVARAARGGDTPSQTLVADCPRATAEAGR